MPPLIYAFGFATSGTALVIGNIVNARIAERVGPTRMLGVGALLLLLGAGSMLALALTGTCLLYTSRCV